MRSIIVFILSSLFLVGIIVLLISSGDNKAPEANTEEAVEENAPITNTDTESKTDSKANGLTVDLSNRGLREVPFGLFDRTGTERLNLSNNVLSGALPAEVRKLQQLKVLDLSNNKFTGVPAEVGQLEKLEVLNLSSNPITGLPYEIGNLKNLKVLDLRNTDYAIADLEVIKQSLPSNTQILTDE